MRCVDWKRDRVVFTHSAMGVDGRGRIIRYRALNLMRCSEGRARLPRSTITKETRTKENINEYLWPHWKLDSEM